MTRRARWWVAFLFHAPGLWLFCSVRLTRGIAKANIVGLALTVIATLVAVLLSTRYALVVGLAVWSVGHVLWGAYLARRLDRDIPM